MHDNNRFLQTFLSSIFSCLLVLLATTAMTTTLADPIRVVQYNPTVPLSHCMTFGPMQNYMFEWQIDTSVRRTLEMRFTANIQRGYTSFGFTNADKLQLVSAYPPESLACGRRLYDNYSPYTVGGDVYPAFPETPANSIVTNISHISHYVMRNLSTNAKQMLDSGGSLTTNVTLMWGFGLESMYSDACYNLDMNGTTEFAQMQVVFTDPAYLKINGTCPQYNGTTVPFRNKAQLKPPPAQLLESEINQNTRMAGLLVGGDMLLQTGQGAPDYKEPPGYVQAGENYANVCQNSLYALKMRWSGFTESVGGVQRYEVTAGTASQPSLYLDRASAGTNQAFQFTGFTMTKNQTLYIKLSAINFAGLARTIALPPMRILNNAAPVFGTVLDGTDAETLGGTVPIQFIRTTTRLAASWRNYMPEDHSSIDANTSVVTENGYDYAVGIVGMAPDSFIAWTSSPGVFNTEVVLNSLTLTHGVKYYFTIRTVNCAGVTVYAYSPGVTVDVASPGRGRVFFSNRTFYNVPVIKRSNKLSLSWTGFTDYTSGIADYQYAIGKTPKPVDDLSNLGMIVNWTSVGTNTRTLNPPTIYSLPPSIQALVPLGTLLYAYVKATDRAGNWAIAFSNSTVVVAD